MKLTNNQIKYLERLEKTNCFNFKAETVLDSIVWFYLLAAELKTDDTLRDIKKYIKTIEDLKKFVKVAIGYKESDMSFTEAALNWIEQSKGNKCRNLEDFFNLYKDMNKHNMLLSFMFKDRK